MFNDWFSDGELLAWRALRRSLCRESAGRQRQRNWADGNEVAEGPVKAIFEMKKGGEVSYAAYSCDLCTVFKTSIAMTGQQVNVRFHAGETTRVPCCCCC